MTAPLDALVRLSADVDLLPAPSPTLPPATRTNHALVGCDEGWLLVDAGASDPATLEALVALAMRSRAEPLCRILLTHHHPDHVVALRALVEGLRVPVAAHAETWARIPKALLPPPDLQETVAGGPWLGVHLHHTPGHAPGHLALETAGGILLAGDLVAGLGTILVDPDEGHMGRYIASLEAMAHRRPALAAPAHGPHDPEGTTLLVRTAAHRRLRHQRVLDAVEAQIAGVPATLEAVAALAYADSPAAPPALTLHATLAHLRWAAEAGEVRYHAPDHARSPGWTRSG
jgi:glyoxylase-like metal-dependent hydrolase (beta-lactamase superfamily II)